MSSSYMEEDGEDVEWEWHAPSMFDLVEIDLVEISDSGRRVIPKEGRKEKVKCI
jgi:hypothetical protein